MNLPGDLVGYIGNLLPLNDLKEYLLVNKRFHKICRNILHRKLRDTLKTTVDPLEISIIHNKFTLFRYLINEFSPGECPLCQLNTGGRCEIAVWMSGTKYWIPKTGYNFRDPKCLNCYYALAIYYQRKSIIYELRKSGAQHTDISISLCFHKRNFKLLKWVDWSSIKYRSNFLIPIPIFCGGRNRYHETYTFPLTGATKGIGFINIYTKNPRILSIIHGNRFKLPQFSLENNPLDQALVTGSLELVSHYIDLFPVTLHLETILNFERVDAFLYIYQKTGIIFKASIEKLVERHSDLRSIYKSLL